MLTRLRRQRWALVAPLMAVLWCVLARQADSSPRAYPVANPTTTQPASAQPSSHFRWRGWGPAQLERVILWVSHVLIRQGDTAGADCSFIKMGWRTQLSVPQRSRAEALALASDLARRARLAPDSFAALAREASEDGTSRERGGALGGIRASQFLFSPQVLDALAALHPGETSDVIETECGYHVFLRQAPPTEQTMSGEHIVIGYEDAPWLRRILSRRDRELPQRSREQARQLALHVQSLAKQAPASFLDLVQQYSEHEDASLGGDFGEWSTREATASQLEVEALATVDVGQIADVIDSPVGYQVIRRTPLRPRKRYAMQLVKLWFEPGAEASAASSKANTERVGREVLARLLAEPTAFARLQQEYCCGGSVEWREGRGPAAAVPLLEPIAFQQIAPELWAAPSAFSVVQRLDPEALPQPAALSFELPPPVVVSVAD